MLLDDDVVTNGQAKASTLSGWFGREEGIEHLLPDLGRNAGAVVAYPDFDAVAEVPGRGSERGLIVAPIWVGFARRNGVEAVRDQVEQRPRDFLREQIDFTRRRVKKPLQGDSEALLLGPRPVIGEIEAFLD